MYKYNKSLVIDSSHTARSVITSNRAFVIWYKGNCVVLKEHPVTIGFVNKELIINRPSIIIVPSYINLKDSYQKAPLTRTNIFKRDSFTCVYCGRVLKEGENPKGILTLDHVHPKSKGGKNTWSNLVTACKRCNQEKNDLTIEEWGREHPNPKRPHYLMILGKTRYIPEEWKKYLLI